jgi:hypothetical protein
MMKILTKIRFKWGRKLITPNIKKVLRQRKNIMKSFFTLQYLYEKSDVSFKDKDGNVIPRWLVYCHDIQGLIHLKTVLLEESDISIPRDLLEVINLDGGKEKLLMCYSWSSNIPTYMKGPKQSLVIALVSKVEESLDNVKILFDKTNANQSE